MRKKLFDLYKIAQKHVGEEYTTKEALKIFGYSKTTDVRGSNAIVFLELVSCNYDKDTIPITNFIWKVRNIKLLRKDQLPASYEKVLYNPYCSHDTWTKIRLGDKDLFIFKSGIHLYYLVPADDIEFWRLKEHGGKL